MAQNILERYSYQTRYIEDIDELGKKILNKTVIPHQLECQPGRLNGEKLCWLSCPYCYGNTAKNTKERLSPERYVQIINQTAHGPHGQIKKIVFAGYATDPLNYERIDDLLEMTRKNNQIFGFHTKGIKVSDRFIDLLTAPDIVKLSYFSVSVDAGHSQSYNDIHGVGESRANIYDKVIENIYKISSRRRAQNSPLDLSATYLITQFNNSTQEVVKAIKDLTRAGVDLIRFSFPQLPRGHEEPGEKAMVPARLAIVEMYNRLKPIVEGFDSPPIRVIIKDFDEEYEITERRTLPCFARFIFPCVGYDGYLSHCSESSALHFRDMALGNLARRDFWDVFYDYDANNLAAYLKSFYTKMEKNDCRCDRKEHVVNTLLKKSGIFNELS